MGMFDIIGCLQLASSSYHELLVGFVADFFRWIWFHGDARVYRQVP